MAAQNGVWRDEVCSYKITYKTRRSENPASSFCCEPFGYPLQSKHPSTMEERWLAAISKRLTSAKLASPIHLLANLQTSSRARRLSGKSRRTVRVFDDRWILFPGRLFWPTVLRVVHALARCLKSSITSGEWAAAVPYSLLDVNARGF